MRNGWCYAGQHSNFRRRRHGNSAAGLARSKFVVCIQNHDQIGNRARGERLSELVDFEGLKLAAGVTVLAPFIPLLFMGRSMVRQLRFNISLAMTIRVLIEAVRKGRQDEFAAFTWEGEVPDPQDETTFRNSKAGPWIEKQGTPQNSAGAVPGVTRESDANTLWPAQAKWRFLRMAAR